MKSGRPWFVVVFAMLATMVPAIAAPAATGDPVLINEILASHTGTDDSEFVELYGTPGASLEGVSFIEVESDEGTSNGTIDHRFDFTADHVIGDNGFFLLGNPAGLATNYGVTPNAGIATDFLENSSATYALVQTASLAGTTVTGSEVVLDAVASTDGGAADSFFFGAPVVGPDGTFFPAGVRRVTDGVDTDTAADWVMADFSLGSANTPTAGTYVVPPPPVEITEIHYDNVGTDEGEAIEISGPEGTDVSGWQIVLYNGNGGAPYNTTTLNGVIPAAGGFSVFYATNGIQNGAPDGIALVDGGGTVVEFLSYEGTFTAVGGPADGMTSVDIGVAEPGAIDESLQRTATGWIGPVESNFLPPLEVDPCSDGVVLISLVQGSGDATACAGKTVTIEGVVVGDYEGPSPNLRGFYVQEEDADQDGDPATSEGIFVFHGNEDTVDLGDLVQLTGTVAEFQGQTQIGFPDSVSVVSSGNMVTAAEVMMPFSSADYLERYEGMLVAFPQTLYVTEFFQLGRFGQVVVSSGDRLQQPTNVAEPGADAAAVQSANNLNRLIVDDHLNNQNPEPILFGRDGNPLTASNTLRGGDTLTGAVGVMTYTWAGSSASGNAYRLRPVGDLSDSGLVPGGGVPMFAAANPRPSGPPAVGGDVKVASFNVLNYFLTIDDNTPSCGPVGFEQECRGAESVLEFDRQRAKLLVALEKLDADVLGLIELENTTGVSPETDLASGLNDLLGAGTYAAIDAGTVGPDVIRVGMIYKPSAVTPLGDPAIYDFPRDVFDEARSRSALAQTFIDNVTGEVFTVVTNHFKSKGASEIADSGGVCALDPTYADCDQGDGQGYFNATRAAHAQLLVDWLATNPTGVTDPDVLIIGDLNSYAMEDPIDVLAAAGYVDLGRSFGGTGAYSYVFDGQWGYLDYAMASSSLASQVTGAAPYHINADEPSVLDYNTNFQSPTQIIDLYAEDEFRTSDHDPIVVGLGLSAVDARVKAYPDTLWPPNHKYRKVVVFGFEGKWHRLDVEITSVSSSEADSGLGRWDRPNDIVVTGDRTVKLRAERYSKDGRVYTIEVMVTDEGGQMELTTTEVIVPHDMRRKHLKWD